MSLPLLCDASPPGVPDPEPVPADAELAERLAALAARALAAGFRSLDDGEGLELLCGLAEDEALRLLESFGSLPEVVGAACADLARVAGPCAALRIKLAQEIADRLLVRPLKVRSVLSCTSAVLAHLRTTMTGAPREQFRVLFLDKRNRLRADEVLGEGSLDHAPVYPREVVRRALELNAAALILAHNHPSADPNPSAADIQMTAQVVEAARVLGLHVHDHFIVAGETVVSLRQLGLM